MVRFSIMYWARRSARSSMLPFKTQHSPPLVALSYAARRRDMFPHAAGKSGTEKIQEKFGLFSQWTNSGVSAKIGAVRFSRCPGKNFANVIFATMQAHILYARMVKHHNICNTKIQICIQAVYRRDEEKVHERYQTEQHGSEF